MCVCVWEVKDQGEFGDDYEKRKGNEQSLSICARVGVATVLAYAGVTHHGTYLQSLYGI